MFIGTRLRELREGKNLSQGDMEKRTGLLRCYTSRVENGHTLPTLETLEKYARALEVPLYRFFFDGDQPPEKPTLPRSSEPDWGTSGKEAVELRTFAKYLARMSSSDQTLLLGLARRMAGRNHNRGSDKNQLPGTARHL
jgi:transcriptional regulator with XRE-family HTH domain